MAAGCRTASSRPPARSTPGAPTCPCQHRCGMKSQSTPLRVTLAGPQEDPLIASLRPTSQAPPPSKGGPPPGLERVVLTRPPPSITISPLTQLLKGGFCIKALPKAIFPGGGGPGGGGPGDTLLPLGGGGPGGGPGKVVKLMGPGMLPQPMHHMGMP